MKDTQLEINGMENESTIRRSHMDNMRADAKEL